MFDPGHLRTLCQMPAGSEPIAILCVGQVESFYPAPMLELEGWDQRRPLAELLYEDCWGAASAAEQTAGPVAAPVSKEERQ